MTASGLKQRLAAILAADAVGYSRLMAADERATVAALDAARGVFRSRIEANQGRVVDTAGDSVLAVFDSAAGAVSAALEIQKALDARLPFRIGVHLGDVFEKPDGTVYGDGVNIAARLQSLADGGGVIVSDAIQGAVRGKVSAAFVDRGEQQVKNIPHPVRAFAVNEGAAPVPASGHEPELSLPEKPSIAVLPFANMSGDPEQAYFADGVTEDIITELSRFHSLFVVARNSTFSYKGKAVDVRHVAKELGVRYVLEGSIRKAEKRVRVTAQLIDALTGTHLWAERYDRDLQDIFALQEELTRVIVAAIAPEINAAEVAKAHRARPGDLSAYEIAVRANAAASSAYAKQDGALADQAITDARKALAIDPKSVLALGVLARAQWQHVFNRTAKDPGAALAEALDACARAIEADRSDHAGYLWKGLLLSLPGESQRWDEALWNSRRAVELNPNDFLALQAHGLVEMIAGNPRLGIERNLAAYRINPRDPWVYNVYVVLAYAHFMLGNYTDGIEWAARAVRDAPNNPPAHANLALCRAGLRDFDGARAAMATAQRVGPDFVSARVAGYCILRMPEDRRRYTAFYRVAAGLDDPGTLAEWLRP